MAAGHCGKLAASLIVIHSPASVSVKGRKDDTFGGTCSTNYACMKRGRDCVRWCTHWGPQDHSVAMVTSGRRAQEAKAQDQSDGMRMRKKISDWDKKNTISVFINTELSLSFLTFYTSKGFFLWRNKKQNSPPVRVQKEPSVLLALDSVLKLKQASWIWISKEFRFLIRELWKFKCLVLRLEGLINEIWRLDFMINDNK